MRSGYLVAVYEFLSQSKHKLRTDLALLAFRTAVRDFVRRSAHDIVVTRLITSVYVQFGAFRVPCRCLRIFESVEP